MFDDDDKKEETAQEKKDHENLERSADIAAGQSARKQIDDWSMI